MSTREVIRLEGVSKRYRLGTIGSRTLVEDVARFGARLRGKPDPLAKLGEENRREVPGGEYVWALRDVNLSVGEGETVGIIGRNGAGKSTLLKLLSRITLPTEGVIRARGRVASLLEIGTGFHWELTGRENVFLNGAILGMRRREVSARLDEIVEFAGVARYLDTPVKRYSTGMLIRLAFAVAAHLDCEILVVDEVLAVGDAEFQRKCIGKMREVSSEGARTVLFVSHNMGMVSALCERGVILERGSVLFDGAQSDALARYEHETRELATASIAERDDRAGKGTIRVTDVSVSGEGDGGPVCGAPAKITVRFGVTDPTITEHARFVVTIQQLGSRLLTLSNAFSDNSWPAVRGAGTLELRVPRLPLEKGEYSLSVRVDTRGGVQDHVEGALFFDVGDGNFYPSGVHLTQFTNTVLVEHDWSLALDADHSGH